MLKLKTITNLALMGSVVATDSVAKQKNIPDVTKISNFHKLQKIMTTKGTVATADHLRSASAVSGNWLTITQDASCSASTPALANGFLMNYCATNTNAETTQIATYAKYSCTEDTSTNTLVFSHTTYTNSACTAGASVQTPISVSTNCASGMTYHCPTSSEVSDVSRDYSNGGLSWENYASSSACNRADDDDVITYGGVKGCVGGIYYGVDSVSVYTNAYCSGTAHNTVTYERFYTSSCGFVIGDDDNFYGDDYYDDYYGDDGYDDGYDDYYYDDNTFGGADDDDSIIVYNNLYQTITYGGDGSDDFCFHVDSLINYKGFEYTYDELKAGKEPECTVPHSPSSKGVVISTSCDKTVRVTDTHLMATTKGFQLAYSLKAGDVLFGDYGSDKCTVKSVEKEKTTQQYFGLNCVHSEVLASGLRASTFGDFHTLPSWYMTYVGGLVGAETASSFGEYIAEWYFQ